MARRIGVFGGTFDPVHIGHLIVASECRHALQLDQVLFVPAGDPPHKPGWPISPAADRVEMLMLAIAGHHEFQLDRTDVDRPGPSYTKDLLVRLAERFPDDRLFFIIGADSLAELHTWKEPEQILALADIAAARRPGVSISLEDVAQRIPATSGRIHLIDTPLIGIASREIRRRVAVSEPISFQVPTGVERYISDHGLYHAIETQDSEVVATR